MMLPASLHVLPGQENGIRNTLKKRKGCRIKVKKSDVSGPHRLLVTSAMLKRYKKAAKGDTVPLQFKPEHLLENMHHQGGFLPLIAAALAPVIGGLAGGIIQKEIAGSGLPDFHGVPWYTGTSEQGGNGLYLNPYPRGSGLYLNPYPRY